MIVSPRLEDRNPGKKGMLDVAGRALEADQPGAFLAMSTEEIDAWSRMP